MNGDEFSGYLMAGERLDWWDQPKQGILLTARDGFLVPFSIMWCGFALFWEASVLTNNAPFFFKLWGLPFVAVGLFMAVGRFFADAWLRQRTFYALTNRRVLIVRLPPFGDFTAVNIDQLPFAQMRESAGGRGTITFEGSSAARASFQGWIPALSARPQLLAIPDAKRVFNEIQKRRNETRLLTA